MQPTLFLKVKDPLEFKLVFYCFSCLPLSVFLGKTRLLLLFLHSKHPGVCPSPAMPPFAGFSHKRWFLQETVSGTTEQI